jgi:hypothetical protein
MGKIEEMVRNLPPDLQKEVEDFIQFLLNKQKRKPAKKLRQDWAGALKDYRDKYTSLELQKKALEWRED